MRDNSEEDLPIVGRSPVMQEVYRVLAKVVSTDLTVMIRGESGTGKELVARKIHKNSTRSKEPFIVLNGALLQPDNYEQELFGTENNNETLNYDDGPDIPASMVQFGGQTAINLSQELDESGMPILGSTADTIDIASDRARFEDFLTRLDIPRPPGHGVNSVSYTHLTLPTNREV